MSALLAGCASDNSLSTRVVGTVPVDASFQGNTIDFTTIGPVYFGRFNLVPSGDQILFCGAGFIVQPSMREGAERVLENYTLVIDGEPRVSDFRFFSSVPRETFEGVEQPHVGQPANCVSAGPAPGPDAEINITSSGTVTIRG